MRDENGFLKSQRLPFRWMPPRALVKANLHREQSPRERADIKLKQQSFVSTL